MVTFADQVAAGLGTTKVFLVGDFNAYTHEDPIEVLYAAGYTDLGSTLDYNTTHNLPLVSRNPFNFILFQPNVSGRANTEFGVPRKVSNSIAATRACSLPTRLATRGRSWLPSTQFGHASAGSAPS